MKFCDKCKKVYVDSAMFCGECGSKLISSSDYDIFGELLDNKTNTTNSNVNDSKSIKTKSQPKEQNRKKTGEILSLISVGLFLVPLYGLVECIISIALNFEYQNKNGRHTWCYTLSIITLILNIIFTLVLFSVGVLPL